MAGNQSTPYPSPVPSSYSSSPHRRHRICGGASLYHCSRNHHVARTHCLYDLVDLPKEEGATNTFSSGGCGEQLPCHRRGRSGAGNRDSRPPLRQLRTHLPRWRPQAAAGDGHLERCPSDGIWEVDDGEIDERSGERRRRSEDDSIDDAQCAVSNALSNLPLTFLYLLQLQIAR